jgi:hypothetical protein
MITIEERAFAERAASTAETLLGEVMMLVTQDAPTDKAGHMAQLLTTVCLFTKIGMCRTMVPNMGSSFDNLCEQLERQWAALKDDGPDAQIDLGDLVFPDGPEDYINRGSGRLSSLIVGRSDSLTGTLEEK